MPATAVFSNHCRKQVVNADELYDFLKDTVASAPDLQEGEEEPVKPKRQRCERAAATEQRPPGCAPACGGMRLRAGGSVGNRLTHPQV